MWYILEQAATQSVALLFPATCQQHRVMSGNSKQRHVMTVLLFPPVGSKFQDSDAMKPFSVFYSFISKSVFSQPFKHDVTVQSCYINHGKPNNELP
jgi:hypothetical protein